MKKNLLKSLLIGILATSVTACVPKPTAEESSQQTSQSGNVQSEAKSESSSSVEESIPDPNDVLDAVPDEVQQFRGDIDVLIYVEGANGTLPDIGDRSKYDIENVSDLCYTEMAPFYAAARAFKEVAPGVKINLIYCSISEYNDRVVAYRDKKGHLPHLMWATDHAVEMIQNGFYCDVSKFCGDEKFDAYYDSFNDYLMSRFNYGGFQAAIPIACEPWGVFANLSTLKEYSVVDYTDSDTYQEWVDNFTWDEFLDACEKTTNDTHAGLSMVVDYLTSYAAPTVYDQFLKEGSVELDNDTVKALIENEQKLTEYTVYDYSDGINGSQAKANFPEAHTWSGTANFCSDQYCTFYAEAPWAISTISKYVKENECNIKVDYLPYPKADEDTDAYTGIAVEGIGVGNLCPIGEDGKEHCYSSTAELEEEVAAFFALFMSADVRATEERANIKYVKNNVSYTGALSLPLVKKGYRFEWQDDDAKVAELGGDPSAEYGDNFSYALAKYFEVNDLYVLDGNAPDVVNYSNITYGLTKILDSVYGDDVTCINFWNEPVNIPDGSTTKDIFDDWQGRYKTYNLGTESYVADVTAMLSTMEEDINKDVETAWQLIQEMLDMYYEEGKYDVLDHSSRNSY